MKVIIPIIASVLLLSSSAFANVERSNTFSILSANVASLPRIISKTPRKNLRTFGKKSNAYDIILMQEMFTRYSSVKKYSNHNYYSKRQSKSLAIFSGRLAGDGLHRLSDFPFTKVYRETWRTCDGFFDGANDCMAAKGFSIATHTVAEGIEIDIFNLHMEAENGMGTDGAWSAAVQAEQLVSAIKESISKERAIIVAGDFNMSYTREERGILLDKIKKLTGLRNPAKELDSHAYKHSIDRFMIRNGRGISLDILELKNERDNFLDKNGKPLSDHSPISVIVEWKKI